MHALHSICKFLAVEPNQLFGVAEKAFVSDRSPKSEIEIVETLLQTAQRLARMRLKSDQPPSMDRILDDWRTAESTGRGWTKVSSAIATSMRPPWMTTRCGS